MKVEICKTKKSIINDNFNMIFSGKRRFFFGGAVSVGIVLSLFGRNEGFLILAFSLGFLGLSALSIFSILRKIKGDKLELTYEFEGSELKVQNPMGIINVKTQEIVGIEENQCFYLLEIKNPNGRNSKLPLYKTGVIEGDIDELINNLRVQLNKEFEEEENIDKEDDIMEDRSELNSVDSDEDKRTEDNIGDKEMKEKDIENKQEKDVKEMKIEDNNEIEITQNNEIESITNNEENEIIEIEESEIQEKIVEENDEVNKVDTYEIRNIVKFQNKFTNDFIRCFKRQLSRVTLIVFIFAAITMGIISMINGAKVFGTIFLVVGALAVVSPVIQVYSTRKNTKGIKSIGIDENDDIVIDNGVVRNVYKKKHVAVGKTEDEEIIVTVLSNKSITFGIKKEEIVEGDPYELFKILKVGKVREFNWLGLFALGVSTIGLFQIPITLGWISFNKPTIAIIISIACVIISLLLAVMAIFSKGKVKKQANWAILFDIIIAGFFVWTYLNK
ncbi:hypothetical protein [Oceanirhabdus sp. W0125-5]|uniref:hypothetical protein n=1 Tax=Oceanirhabdus sp. W0125-5 TaxID=2999116 RepID=UPI0022F2F493|nr:hypothetical protein [Oceanirhabdus sp. W0125-5]WBW98079.1 hypothetical protein OW730_04755 [Oceanirhabdus sp. W0125-5]